MPIVIGADEENPVTLSSADWWNVYCDNMNDLRRGKAANSAWHLQVAKDGEYEIALRRWPKEADAADRRRRAGVQGRRRRRCPRARRCRSPRSG